MVTTLARRVRPRNFRVKTVSISTFLSCTKHGGTDAMPIGNKRRSKTGGTHIFYCDTVARSNVGHRWEFAGRSRSNIRPRWQFRELEFSKSRMAKGPRRERSCPSPPSPPPPPPPPPIHTNTHTPGHTSAQLSPWGVYTPFDLFQVWQIAVIYPKNRLACVKGASARNFSSSQTALKDGLILTPNEMNRTWFSRGPVVGWSCLLLDYGLHEKQYVVCEEALRPGHEQKNWFSERNPG